MIESCQRSRKRGGGIPMDQYPVWHPIRKNRFQAGQHPSGNVLQRLTVFHDIQIIIRRDVEQIQHLIEHVPML